jgi:ubiquinone/menaquinone biosynthesis C-methylase UbiE
MNEISQRLKKINGGKILDIATGSGQFIHFLMENLKSYKSFTGIDMRENKQINTVFEDKPITFQKMDAYQLQFPNESFDTVTISHSLHHFEQPKKIFEEMKRVLKNSGYMIIHEMIADGKPTPAQQSHIKIHHWFAKMDRKNDVYHSDTYKRKELENIIKMIKFEEIECFDYQYPVENLFDEKTINSYCEIIEKILSTRKNLPAKLLKEGKEIKEYIQKNGYAPANMMLCIGKK